MTYCHEVKKSYQKKKPLFLGIKIIEINALPKSNILTMSLPLFAKNISDHGLLFLVNFLIQEHFNDLMKKSTLPF